MHFYSKCLILHVLRLLIPIYYNEISIILAIDFLHIVKVSIAKLSNN